jgi:hypothetical protein
MNFFHFTEADKQAIRDNRDELVDLFETKDLVVGYKLLADECEYALLADIAPIFETLSLAVIDEIDVDEDIDLDDEIAKVDKEIIAFLRLLPPELD